MQTKVYRNSFTLKRNSSQTFKSSSCKKRFFLRLCYWYYLLRLMLFIPHDNWETSFFTKNYWNSDVFLKCHVVVFFQITVLKEVCILCYPHRRGVHFPTFLCNHVRISSYAKKTCMKGQFVQYDVYEEPNIHLIIIMIHL